MSELWRLRNPGQRHQPAHRVIPSTYVDAVFMTACGWRLETGVLVSRFQAADLESFPCRRCLKGTL